MSNIENLSAKELKVIATEKGINFMKNASADEMRKILANHTLPTPSADAPPLKGSIVYANVTASKGIEDGYEITTWEFTVITPVKRGGKRYNPGESIRIDNLGEADSLISSGVIR